jgi:acyltransferase
MAPRRSVAIDVVRLVGITAVALGHFRANTPDAVGHLVRDLTFSWHVPLFFFLAGYLWRAQRSLREEVATRAKTLLLPFASWTVILLAPLLAVGAVRGELDREVLGEVVWGGERTQGIFAPFWFLPVLFLSTVLYRFLGTFLSEWTVLLVATAAVAASSLRGDDLAALPHVVFFAVPMMLMLQAGRAVRTFESRVPLRGSSGALLLVIGISLAVSGAVRPLDVKVGDFGTPVLSVVNALVICTGLLWVAQRLFPASADRRWHEVVSSLAQTVLVVLLTHVLFFQACGLVHLPAVLTLPVSLGLGFGLGLAIRRTALSPWLVGMPRVRRERAAMDRPATRTRR